jgi:glycosyltransferase involved in cell wall biosynthesis
MVKPHVLVIPSWYPTRLNPISGVFFREQTRALRKYGLTMGVVAPDLRSLRSFRQGKLWGSRFQRTFGGDEGIPTFRVHGWSVPKLHGLNRAVWLRQANRLIETYVGQFGKPDVIHAHGTLWGGVAAAEASRTYDIPCVITEHSSDYLRGLILEWQIPFIEAALQDASRLFAVSASLAKAIAPYAAKREIRVIPNTVDVNFFTIPGETRPSQPFRFLSVALLTANKGIHLLLRAFQKAFKGRHDVLLEIGGDGEQRKYLEKLTLQLGVDGQVRFLGMLNREQVRESMWRSHAFVLPSYRETFGVVLIEAMATGLPVIATRSGGPEEFVDDRVGQLVAPGSVDELCWALIEARMGEGATLLPGTAIREAMVKSFSEEAVARKLCQQYRDVMRHFHPTGDSGGGQAS